MKNKIFFSLASAILVLGIIFSQTSAVFADSKYYVDTPSDHEQTHYGDMDLSWLYEYEGTMDCIEKLEEAIKKSGNDDEVRVIFKEVLNRTNIVYTQTALIQNEYYKNIEDKTLSNRMFVISEENTKIFDYTDSVISQMMESEYAYIVEDTFGVEDADSFRNLDRNTPEEETLIKENKELTIQYESLIENMTMDVTDSQYETAANIYIKMVENYKRIAQIEGDNSFIERAYKGYYRDYTPDEAQVFKREVKVKLVPLMEKIVAKLSGHYDAYMGFYNEKGPSKEEIVDVIGKYLPLIDEELMSAYEYMTEYDLICLDNIGDGMDMGYTTRLPYYGTPYILNNTNEHLNDVTDTIHEYGHFNHMYHVAEYAINSGSNLDVDEINSQGLELLFLKYANEIYGDKYAEVAIYDAMYRLLNAAIEGCVHDEFQQRAYEEEKLTPEKLKDIYLQVASEYGEEDVDGKMWIIVHHTFQDPFYYVSYATSAVGALEIFTLSLDDREKAVDAYMKISALEGYKTLKDATDIIGIGNIMEAGTISPMCDNLSQKCDSGELITKTIGEAYLTPDTEIGIGTIIKEIMAEMSEEEGMDMNAAETMVFIYVVGAIIGILFTTTVVFLVLTIIFTTKNRNKNKLIAKYRAAMAAQLQTDMADESKITSE